MDKILSKRNDNNLSKNISFIIKFQLIILKKKLTEKKKKIEEILKQEKPNKAKIEDLRKKIIVLIDKINEIELKNKLIKPIIKKTEEEIKQEEIKQEEIKQEEIKQEEIKILINIKKGIEESIIEEDIIEKKIEAEKKNPNLSKIKINILTERSNKIKETREKLGKIYNDKIIEVEEVEEVEEVKEVKEVEEVKDKIKLVPKENIIGTNFAFNFRNILSENTGNLSKTQQMTQEEVKEPLVNKKFILFNDTTILEPIQFTNKGKPPLPKKTNKLTDKDTINSSKDSEIQYDLPSIFTENTFFKSTIIPHQSKPNILVKTAQEIESSLSIYTDYRTSLEQLNSIRDNIIDQEPSYEAPIFFNKSTHLDFNEFKAAMKEKIEREEQERKEREEQERKKQEQERKKQEQERKKQEQEREEQERKEREEQERKEREEQEREEKEEQERFKTFNAAKELFEKLKNTGKQSTQSIKEARTIKFDIRRKYEKKREEFITKEEERKKREKEEKIRREEEREKIKQEYEKIKKKKKEKERRLLIRSCIHITQKQVSFK